MYQKILNSINWSHPKIIYTKEGTQNLYEAPVPESFWGVWRIHKEKIKSRGISVKRIQGKWILNKIGEATPETINTEGIKLDKSFLLDYQIDHTKILIADILNNNAALDASDTGTGKTYSAIAIAKYLKRDLIGLVPKSSISKWKKLCRQAGVKSFIKNYEQFKIGNTPFVIVKDISVFNKKKEEEEIVKSFAWDLNPDKKYLIVFDEGHKCKNRKTQNSDMLIAAKSFGAPVLVMSATIADNPLQMYALGRVLGLFNSEKEYWKWAYKRGVSRAFFGTEFSGSKKDLDKIHHDIFPTKGHRIAIRDLGDKFPENLIISDSYDMENSSQIQNIYDNMKEELARLSNIKKQDEEKEYEKGKHLVTTLRARQEIELLKIPTFVEMTEDLIEEGNSVAIFLNFNESVKAIKSRLGTDCIITGEINSGERERNRLNFQEGKERVIILNSQAGGESIDLHDVLGNYPRVSLISPTYSAQNLKQLLGRLPRAGAKSKVVQKIIFAAGTIEEEVADRVNTRLKNISLINDGDLEGI